MNRYDYLMCLIITAWYVVGLWFVPLNIVDLFDNRYLNVIAFHLFILAAIGVVYGIVVIKEKSNCFYR